MKNNNLTTELNRDSSIKARYASQCDTFKHLSVADSIRYNWAKHHTSTQSDASAVDIARSVNQLDLSILILMAESPTTSQNTLDVLAFNPSSAIRQAVCDNPRTSLDTLTMLARDEDPEVRYAMAENHNMSMDILIILSEDENPFVRLRAEDTLSVILSETID